MAKTASEDAKTPPKNSAARQEIIRDTIRQVLDLESQAKEINTRRRELVNRRIKGDLNMKVADFNGSLRLARLEGDARDEFFDALKETFAAQGIRIQLDLFGPGKTLGGEKAKGKKAKGGNGKAAPASPVAALTFAEGKDAGLRGKNADTNPHKKKTPAYAKWMEGWQSGQAQLVEQQHGAHPAQNRAH